ncbi:MAG: sugar phosphate isomerase/epimerase [Clostridiales bacterium]|nr:sugar phosphate isomerase/epimerase [Clostridiales bacterium]
MKIATLTEVMGVRVSDEAAVRIIAGAGFDAVDFSMFELHDDGHILNGDGYKDYALNIRKIGEDLGVFFNQAHAPFPSMKRNNDEYNERTFKHIVRSMEVASLLGVGIIVVHPSDISKENNLEINLEFYNKLMPYARDLGLKVALENMWGWSNEEQRIVPNICSVPEDFNRYVDALDSRYFTACLDIGHCGLVGCDAPTMIREMGHDRIKALHVHDNDNLHDLHYFPFSSELDWGEITKALADIDYDGILTFEADNTLKKMPPRFYPTAIKYLHDIGRQLVKMIEANK